MKVKTSELTGAALGYSVAVAIHGSATFITNPMMSDAPYVFITSDDGRELRVSYSTKWASSGRLVDEFKISVFQSAENGVTEAFITAKRNELKKFPWQWKQVGQTPLIAICRVVVACKLGDEVEVPDELLEAA